MYYSAAFWYYIDTNNHFTWPCPRSGHPSNRKQTIHADTGQSAVTKAIMDGTAIPV